jgi:hypothetical protein
MADFKRELLGGNVRFDELMGRVRVTSMGKAVSASEWQEIEEFIQENLLTKERLEKEALALCRDVAREQVQKRLRDLILQTAAEHFKTGQDEVAKELRDCANKLLKE